MLVVEVDAQHRLTTLAYLDVAHEDVFDYSSSARIGFDTQHAVEVWRVHHAVVSKHVAQSAADFRTYYHTAVAVLHFATANDDVLARHGTKATVCVATALYGDAVVARVEEAVFNQHSVARFRVAAVAIRAVVVDVYTSHNNIGTFERMNHPER